MTRYTDLSDCFSGLLFPWKLFFFTMEDQHRHHFLILGAMMCWSVVISLCGCWLLPCAVPGGAAASWAVSVSSAPVAAGVVDVLDSLFTSALTGPELDAATYTGLYPASCQFWLGLLHLPLASVSKSCNGAKPPYLGCAEQKCCCSNAKMLPSQWG